MIYSRKRAPADPLVILSCWLPATHDDFVGQGDLLVLITIHVMQRQTNSTPTLEELSIKTGHVVSNLYGKLAALKKAGYLETLAGGYNVTEKGEYKLRGIQTILTRMVNQSKLSRWNAPKGALRDFLRNSRKIKKEQLALAQSKA